ncbi:MAG: LysR family transcriptional regulator [Alphaproteobacteria bacterium]
MDRFDAMTLLLTVVSAGSLSAAGRRLNMPLATVSRRIGELEARLRTQLLVRSTRRIELTEAGRAYVDAARRIVEEVNEAERTVSGEYLTPKGDLAITAPIEFGRLHVLPTITDFLASHPDITARMMLTDRLVDLPGDHIDVALRIGSLPDSSLIATKLGTIRRIVVASPSYLAAHGDPPGTDDLGGHACVTFNGMASPPWWPTADSREGTATTLHCRLVVNSAQAAIEAAIAGVGMTCVLSYQAATAIRAGTLTEVLTGVDPTPIPVNLVHRGGRILPLKLRAFLDYATPRLRARLAAGIN